MQVYTSWYQGLFASPCILKAHCTDAVPLLHDETVAHVPEMQSIVTFACAIYLHVHKHVIKDCMSC